MKPINFPLDLNNLSYLRCINKDDLSYVDILINRKYGQFVFDTYWPLIKIADGFCGRTGLFSDEKTREYHYCALFTVDKDSNNIERHGFPEEPSTSCIGFMIENDIRYKLVIDLETNEIISKKTFD